MKKLLNKIAGQIDTGTAATLERSALLLGKIAAVQGRRTSKLGALYDAEFCVSSQWGEDGIIDWLVEHLPGIPETFIEFGVETYAEANTRFLLQNRNWRGLIIDGDPKFEDRIKGQDIYWRNDIQPRSAFITRDNINELISGAGLSGEVGILSVDIDGNDYWVWDAIDVIDPWIVIAEYNSAFGDRVPVSQPYDPAFVRERHGVDKLYYGASIGALHHLAARRGLVPVGANLAGSNVFYVREDKAGQILERIEKVDIRPSLFREALAPQNDRRLSAAERSGAIGHRAVVDVVTGESMTIASLADAFSPRWQDVIAGRASRAA